MPWTIDDVEKHTKGLSPKAKALWVKVANGTRKRQLAAGKSEKEADSTAIRAANGVAKNIKESYEFVHVCPDCGYQATRESVDFDCPSCQTPCEIVMGDPRVTLVEHAIASLEPEEPKRKVHVITADDLLKEINSDGSSTTTEATITKGMARTMAKGARSVCPQCGLAIPKYVGRYPKYCPECGAVSAGQSLRRRRRRKRSAMAVGSAGPNRE